MFFNVVVRYRLVELYFPLLFGALQAWMCISEEGILFVLWGGTRSVWELVC